MRIIDFTAHDDKALYSQLDAIFMMILGKDTKVHPTNASVHFIKTAAGNAKRNVNGVMKIDRDMHNGWYVYRSVNFYAQFTPEEQSKKGRSRKKTKQKISEHSNEVEQNEQNQTD